jgi:hypothetical protein
MNKIAFLDGYMEKTSLDLNKARKAVNAMKNSGEFLRAGVVDDGGFLYRLLGGDDMHRLVNNIKAKGSDYIGPVSSTVIKEGSRGDRVTNKIFAKGDFLDYVTQNHGFIDPELVSAVKKNPKYREMINRLALMHEGAEGSEARRLGPYFEITPRFGHNSPGVLLRESNMLASLPEEYKPVKDFFTQARRQQVFSAGEVPSGHVGDISEIDMLEKALPGFKYGQTRVSNKAVKRMDALVRDYFEMN